MAAETKTLWVAYTNSDCTEGRGHDVPIGVCYLEATAIRLARKRYVQGSDGPVREVEMVYMDGVWHVPSSAVFVYDPTEEDLRVQKVLDAKKAAVIKAKAAGLTDADLAALGSKV